MSTVESVFRRSRELSNPPYSVSLYLNGFEVGLQVYGVVCSDGDTELVTELEAVNPLLATENIPTIEGSVLELDVGDISTFVEFCPVATSIPEVFHPSVDSSVCCFEYMDSQYLVKANAKRIFDAKVRDSSVSMTFVSERAEFPPINTHIERNTGEIRDIEGGLCV